jgi:ureidoacrylate peracid hydrolase
MANVRALVGPSFFRFDQSKNPALLVIDMQNEFVEEGAYYSAHPNSLKILPNIERIIKTCRGLGIPVIWTMCDHGPPAGGLLLEKFPPIRDERILWRDTHSYELYPDMIQPEKDEFKLVKHKYDSFDGTDLEMYLRNKKVNTLIITGISTNICCETTARTAFSKDYYVGFVSDATACADQSTHEATLRNIEYAFGRVLSTKELTDELSHREPIESTPLRQTA